MSANQQLLLQLEERFDLQQLLVSNLCDFVAAARRWLAEPVEAGGGGGARHRLNSGPEGSGGCCMKALMKSQGRFSKDKGMSMDCCTE
eukprot:1157309-Pelagomonas_calceolata.AAC.4